MKVTTTRGEVKPPRRFYICDRTKCRYKAASNWATVLGYENNSIAAIEGSPYEA